MRVVPLKQLSPPQPHPPPSQHCSAQGQAQRLKGQELLGPHLLQWGFQ